MTYLNNSATGDPKVDWAEIRRNYEDAAKPLAETAAKAGLTSQKLVYYARCAGWTPRTPAGQSSSLSAAPAGAALKPTHLATRLKRLIAREIESIESEAARKRDAVEKERDARRLSSLVRSLEKLNDIKAAKAKRDPKANDGGGNGDVLRAELERRLARLVAGGGAGSVSSKPDAGGDGVAC